MYEDEAEFAGHFAKYRPELQVRCYRMLGSVEESEDLVQETFLRAWRRRETSQGRATFRAWLYRIATNACLDFLDRRPREPLSIESPSTGPLPQAAVPWLQPCPDSLLSPDAVVVGRETIELAFLAAIQHLPPRQRAVLILRDLLGWSAKETAGLLESSVASVNSALQRARPTMKQQLSAHRMEWAPSTDPTEEERAVLQQYMDAIERADDAALLRKDARTSHQGHAGGHMGAQPAWYEGRDAIVAGWEPILHGPDAREFRFVATSANRQPAAGSYVRVPGETEYEAFALVVLRIQDAAVAEVNVFDASLFPLFGLPQAL